MRETRNAYRIFAGEPLGKWVSGIPRKEWEDNIKMGLREIVFEDGKYMELTQDFSSLGLPGCDAV
jgi:hypothetical protein